MNSDRLQFYVGVDFGTTGSALSFVLSDKTELRDIETINVWPGDAATSCKVPSKIAFAAENDGLRADAWGSLVKNNMMQYSWFKLLLDSHTKLSEYDDPTLKDVWDEGMCRIPADKSPREVCAAYLKGIYGYLISQLDKKYRPEIVKATPIEFWLTVPAIWSDAAKAGTMAAAKQAGFGSRPLDTICLITEPEAAALAALDQHIPREGRPILDPVKPGEGILVCDCGGGTVDITTYTVLACKPRFEFQELCAGKGAKCGATTIDRRFNAFMIKTFGKAYESLPFERRSPGSSMMRSFESAKRAFGSGSYLGLDETAIQVELPMDAKRSDHYDPSDGTVTISKEEMAEFFAPAVTDILRLVKSQIKLAKKNCKRDIDRIILVGGFGDSEFLNARMRAWCQENGGIKLTCPVQCQAAIVKGAALRGLQKMKPKTRYSRRHYGFASWQEFREGVDEERNAVYDEFDRIKYCRNRMTWVISKGQAIDQFSKFKHEMTETMRVGTTKVLREAEVELLCCDEDEAPELASDASVYMVGSVGVEYTKEDFQSSPKRYNPKLGKSVRNLTMVLEVDLSAQNGMICFKTKVDGRKAGEATISFDTDAH